MAAAQTDAVAAYKAHLRKLASSQPLLLLAHAYTQYMAMAAGGQIIRRAARKHMRLPDDAGTAAFEFGGGAGGGSGNELRARLKAQLNAAAEGMSSATQQRVRACLPACIYACICPQAAQTSSGYRVCPCLARGNTQSMQHVQRKVRSARLCSDHQSKLAALHPPTHTLTTA